MEVEENINKEWTLGLHLCDGTTKVKRRKKRCTNYAHYDNNKCWFHKEHGKLGFRDFVVISKMDGFAAYLSNWFICSFKLPIKNVLVDFTSTEQYIMYCKALLMGDPRSASKIIRANHPRTVNNLGRKVKPWNQKLWDQNKERLAFEANLAKFTQNVELRDRLLATGDKILVEASSYGRIWGAGLGPLNSKIYHPERWTGLNLHGECLTMVRRKLRTCN